MWALGSGLHTDNYRPLPYHQEVLADSPVHYWRMNEPSGSPVNLATPGSPGTYNPVIAYNPVGGPVEGGGYISLSGTVRPGLNTGVTTSYTSQVTLECWFRAAPSPANSGTIVGKRVYFASSHSAFPIYAYWDKTQKRVYFVLSSGNDYTSDYTLTGPVLEENRWYHLVLVYKGGAGGFVEMYIDGEPVARGSHSVTVSTHSTTWRFGNSEEYGGGTGLSAFTGDLAEGAIYDSVLSPGRIRAHFLAAKFRDPYRDKVSIFLPLDYSSAGVFDTNGRRWLVGGNTTYSATQKRFWSNSLYFDGNGDYLLSPRLGDLAFGTGDFTVDLWIYPTAWPSSGFSAALFSEYDATTGIALQYRVDANGVLRVLRGDTILLTSDNLNLALNKWYHVAVTRGGGYLRVFVDGVQRGSVASTHDFTVSTRALSFGALNVGSYAQFFTGYMSHIRVTRGAARWDGPFAPPVLPDHVGYDPHRAQVTALMSCSSAQDVTPLPDVAGATWSVVGNTRPRTEQRRFGATALYLDGASDAIVLGHSSGNSLSSGDFTVELWAYMHSKSSTVGFIGKRPNSATYAPFIVFFDYSSQKYLLYASTSGTGWALLAIGSVVPDLQKWHHVAVQRKGNTLALLVDGRLSGTGTLPSDMMATTSDFAFGASGTDGSSAFNGYIDDIRITKGLARYDVPPSQPPQFDNPNDVVLLNFDGDLSDASGRTWTAGGDAAVSSAQSKFGGSSLYLDGNGDYISAPASTDFNMPGDFTVEAWICLTAFSAAGAACIAGTYNGAVSSPQGWAVRITGSPSTSWTGVTLFTGTNTLSWTFGTPMSLNTWYHVVVERTGSSVRALLNGYQVGSVSTNTDSLSSSVTPPLWVGGQNDTTNRFWFPGYIDALRVTNGVARYAPPQHPFPLAKLRR